MTASDPIGDQQGGTAVSGAKVARSFAWQGGAFALAQAISWVATIVVIRLLAPSDYGLMAMANLFVGLLLRRPVKGSTSSIWATKSIAVWIIL